MGSYLLASFVGLLFYVLIKFTLAVHWDLVWIIFGVAALIASFKKTDLLYLVVVAALISLWLLAAFSFKREDNNRTHGFHPCGHEHLLRNKEEVMANFLFVLSKDDVGSATRCFQFSKIAYSKGHKVDVFLIDDGVKWADSSRDMTGKTATGDCPNDYLPYLVENEIPIGV